MKRVAVRIILAALAMTFAAPFLGFALHSWLSSPEDSAGLNLGVIVGVAAVVSTSYLSGVIGTGLLGWALAKSGDRETPMDRYWLGIGTVYSLLGGTIMLKVVA